MFTTDVCPDVTGLTVAGVTAGSVTLIWDSNPMAQGWAVEYGSVGFTQGQGTLDTSLYNSFTATGLTEGLAYDFHVKAICGTGWTSENWAGTTATTESVGQLSALNSQFSIFPNPTNGITTVSIKGVSGKVRIAVVDMNGRTVTTKMLECSADCEKTMEVDNLHQGAYFVRITSDNVNMVRKLIVR